jgi:hypothetical protein
MLSSEYIRNQLKILNPQLYQAAYGTGDLGNYMNSRTVQPQSFSEWLDQQSQLATYASRSKNPLEALFKAPGLIDPRVMNYSLQMNENQGQTAMTRAQGMLGKANYSGGLAHAYTMANLAARNQGKQQIFQNYALESERLRRSDIELGQSMLSNSLGMASSNQQAAASVPVPGWGQMAGQAISTGLSAYGGLMDMGYKPKWMQNQAWGTGNNRGITPGIGGAGSNTQVW